ncbi:MAG: hypothetical protein ACK5N8_03410 [Alphaproteobacteria bacterium]
MNSIVTFFSKKTTFISIISTINLFFMPIASAEYVTVQNRRFSNEEFKDKGSLKRFLIYPEDDREAPEYRKVYDEYILDVEELQIYGELPPNRKKDEDLSKMSHDSPIQLK